MSKSRWIALSADEWSLCVQVANARQVSAIKSKRKDSVNKKSGWMEEFEKHVMGCVGEMAVAKALNITWTGSVDTFKSESDLAGDIQVRHRSGEMFDLIVRHNDPDDHVFVLSRGMPPNLVEVVGWIKGSDAKREEWLSDPGRYGRPAFFVDAEWMKPIDTINKENA